MRRSFPTRPGRRRTSTRWIRHDAEDVHYLVALAVGDFVCREGAADAIPIRVCATPDKHNLTGFALEAAQRNLTFFNRYYATKYPFKKLGILGVPDFAAGAMENTAGMASCLAFRAGRSRGQPESAGSRFAGVHARRPYHREHTRGDQRTVRCDCLRKRAPPSSA